MTTVALLDVPRPVDARRRRALLAPVAAAAAVFAVGAALLPTLLGPSGTPPTQLEQQVARSVTGLAPSTVSCPTDVTATVFTCTGTVAGRATRYTVTRSDAGRVIVTGDVVVATAAVEEELRADMAGKTGLDLTAVCDTGGPVVVAAPGASIRCTVADAQNPAERLDVTATVVDATGGFAFAIQD